MLASLGAKNISRDQTVHAGIAKWQVVLFSSDIRDAFAGADVYKCAMQTVAHCW